MSDPPPMLEQSEIPLEVPLFPLPNVVLYPCALLPLHVFEPRYRRMVEEARRGDQYITMVMLKPGWEEGYYGRPPIHSTGCVGRMISCRRLEDGRFDIVLCGVRRVRVLHELSGEPYRKGRIELLSDLPQRRPALAEKLKRALIRRVADLPPQLVKRPNLSSALEKLDAPLGCCTDLTADSLVLPPATRQSLLEDRDPISRAERLIRFTELQVFAHGLPEASTQPSIN